MTAARPSGTLTSCRTQTPAARIVEREVSKLERRAAAARPDARHQRELVVASLLVRPDAGHRTVRPD
jgi:hypothetical protein